MPESAPFTGAGFALESLSQPTPATLRVRFTQVPLRVSSGGTHDALNAANYTVSGPAAVTITGTGAVASDSQSVDLQFSVPLVSGTWTITGSSAIQTSGAVGLTAPLSASVVVVFFSNPDSITGGVLEDDAEDILRKHLSPALKGTGWSSIIAGMATGDAANFANAALAYDQLYRSTASGIYLDRKMGDDGVRRPANIGMSDAVFREYGISINAHKLTQNAILDVLEIFYGSDAVRAYSETALAEPYNLGGGETLTVLVDEIDSILTTFDILDFALPGSATAIEVAAALTRSFELNSSTAYAVAHQNTLTGLTTVRIYSGAHGLRSGIRVISGVANSWLQFALQIVTPPVGTTPSTVSWNVTKPTSTTTRFTVASGAVNLTLVRVGDYANILGAGFLVANRGSYPIVNVSYTYDITGVTLTQFFDVLNAGTAQSGVSEVSLSDLLFFRPQRQSIQTGSGRTVVVAQDGNVGLDIQVPATSLGISRTVNSGAYLNVNSILQPTTVGSAFPITRNTQGVVYVLTNGTWPAGFGVGSQILVDGIVPSSTPPAVTAGSLASSIADASPVTISSLVKTAPISNTFWGTATLLADGMTTLIAGGACYDSISGGPTTESACTRFQLLTATTLAAPAQAQQWTYSWNATASLPAVLQWHSALLASYASYGADYGEVFVVGGATVSGTTATLVNTTYIYNPTTNAWATGPTLTTARCKHSSSMTQNGTLFIMGGATSNTAVTASVEILNTAIVGGTYSAGSTLNVARADARSFNMNIRDGSIGIGILGGVNALNLSTLITTPSTVPAIGTIVSELEVWTTASGLWQIQGNMTYARTAHAVVVLPDNRIFVSGGYGYFAHQTNLSVNMLATAEIWDPNTRCFQSGGSMSTPRANHTLVYLASSNKIMVIGGWTAAGNSNVVAEYYDLNLNAWTLAPFSPSARSSFNAYGTLATTQITSNAIAVATIAGPVLVVGGETASGATTSMQLIIPASDKIRSGELNGIKTVTSVNTPSAGYFTYSTPGQLYYSSNSALVQATPGAAGVAIVTFGAQASTILSPFVYDTSAGAGVTSISTTLSQVIYKNQQYALLLVGSTANFPNEPGYLIANFGYQNATYPIPYLGVYSSTALILDYTYVFPENIPLTNSNGNAVNVNLLIGPGIWVPTNPTLVGSFYLTASTAGTAAALSTIDEIVGEGLNISEVVIYPGDYGLGAWGYGPGPGKASDEVYVWDGAN